MIHFDDAAVERYCDLPTVTDRLEEAWHDLAFEQASTTVRVRTSIEAVTASAMAAVLPRREVAGGKLYVTAGNRFEFVVVLFSGNGLPLATFSANSLTGLRTGAATAVALRHLAPPGAAVATLFGAGNQAPWQALALAQELDLAALRLCGRTALPLERLEAWAHEVGLPARVVLDRDEALRDADVVVTATSAYEPVFSGARLEAHALVCAVGSAKPDRREVDAETVRRASFIVADGVAGAKLESGDLIAAAAEGALDWDAVVEIEDVVAGTVPRPVDAGIVLFESQGIALQDVATAALVWERYVASVG